VEFGVMVLDIGGKGTVDTLCQPEVQTRPPSDEGNGSHGVAGHDPGSTADGSRCGSPDPDDGEQGHDYEHQHDVSQNLGHFCSLLNPLELAGL